MSRTASIGLPPTETPTPREGPSAVKVTVELPTWLSLPGSTNLAKQVGAPDPSVTHGRPVPGLPCDPYRLPQRLLAHVHPADSRR